MPIRFIFRVFALLLGIFYLDTVCQTDAGDARAYYGRGLPEYVAAAQPVTVAAPVRRLAARPAPRRVAVAMGRQRSRLAARAVTGPPEPAPLPRRWLRCRVLRV